MIRSLLELLGLADGAENEETFDDDFGAGFEERKQRMLRPVPPSASVIICRDGNCPANQEELAEAIRKGKVLIADLRKIDRESGQAFLDFISGVIHAAHGFIARLAPGIFIAAAKKSMVEEWDYPIEERGDRKVEGSHHGS